MSNSNKDKFKILFNRRLENVVLKKLIVKKMYNVYQYDVNFFNDVTFIHGINGCGKTTILNLITTIITGQLYRLFDFSFDRIELDYVEAENHKKIFISKLDEIKLTVVYNEQEYNFQKINWDNQVDNYEVFDNTLIKTVPYIPQEIYFKQYHWLEEIKTSFNFIYLPLSRNNNGLFSLYDIDYRYARANRRPKSESLEESLNFVQDMIKENFVKIMSKINEINDKFRSDMFKTSFHINQTADISKVTNYDKEFYGNKDKLVKTFQDLNILNNDFKSEINEFYNKLKEMQNRLKSSDRKNEKYNSDTLLTLVSNYSRIQQILEISSLADNMNNEKEEILMPIKKFISVINNFFLESNKEVRIDYNSGKLYFIVNNCPEPIELKKLSSGEKQLLIFFAYLVFGLDNQEKGIFIVDEPELSLHLSWQRKFVESIFQVDKNVQFIFATHSPEIIGKYRDRAVELQQNIAKCTMKED